MRFLALLLLLTLLLVVVVVSIYNIYIYNNIIWVLVEQNDFFVLDLKKS